MTPAALTIITLFAKYAPDVVEKIIEFAHKNDIKKADWDAVFTDIKSLDEEKAVEAARARATV